MSTTEPIGTPSGHTNSSLPLLRSQSAAVDFTYRWSALPTLRRGGRTGEAARQGPDGERSGRRSLLNRRVEADLTGWRDEQVACVLGSQDGAERVATRARVGGVADPAEREESTGIRPGDPILLSPDYRVDELLSLYTHSSPFRGYTRETKRNYITDVCLFLNFQNGSAIPAAFVEQRLQTPDMAVVATGSAGRRLLRQGAVVDDVLHDEGGGQALDPGQSGELLVVELLEGGQVGGGDTEQVVGFAEQALRLDDVRDSAHGLFEGRDGVGGLPAQGGEDERLEVQADGGRVDDGAVAADRALAFEVAQATVAGRDAEPHASSQLGDGQAAIHLQLGKNLPVQGIHREDSVPYSVIMRKRRKHLRANRT